MTPQSPIKREVGIRELHNRLSHYVQQVANGAEVVVTSRGKRVARLAPLEGEDPLGALRRRGLVREPERPRRRAAARKRGRPSRSVSELVRDQRR
jgi:prevent-host-death family protein